MSNTEPMEHRETMDLTTAQRVEEDKITRRAALRKLGFGAGLAAFSLLGVDDFARMAGQRMERMAYDDKVVAQVAKEFQQVGIAEAMITPRVAQSPSQVGAGYGKQCATSQVPQTCLQNKCLATYGINLIFFKVCSTDCNACIGGGEGSLGGSQ